MPLEGGLAHLSGHLDFDPSTLPRHTVMANRTEPKLRRIQTRYGSMTSKLLTLQQVTQIHGQTVCLPQMVGTPADVTDQLEAYFDFVGGDGFMVSPIYSPARLTSSSTWWCRSCNGAGGFGGYAGLTQRDHLGQDR